MSDKLDKILALVEQVAQGQKEIKEDLREFKAETQEKMGLNADKVNAIDLRLNELSEVMINGFAGVNQLITSMKSVASSVDEHQAYVDLLNDKMTTQEAAAFQLRKK